MKKITIRMGDGARVEVTESELKRDLEDGTVELSPHQGYTVPRGVVHRTRAEQRTVMLMVEGSTVDPRGD